MKAIMGTQAIFNDTNSSSMPLQGKRLLIIGARNGAKSVAHIETAVNAGAEHVYVAINPNDLSTVSSILIQRLPYAQSKVQVIVIEELCSSFVKDHENQFMISDLKKAQLIASLLKQKAEEGNQEFRIDACISFQEDLLNITADLQEIFDVPGCNRSGVATTVNKYMFHKAAKEHNLGHSYYASLGEFLSGKADPRMKYPLVIKPTEGSGSAGVFFVHSLEELLEKVHSHELYREMRHRSLLIPYDKWLIEEFLEGPELGVELIMSHGECIFASVMEVVKTPPPIFQGIARHYPTSLGDDCDREVMDECIRAVKALGLNNSVIDVDVKYVYNIDGTTRGPVILEINCRMGGHSVSVMHKQVFGIDLVLEHMRCGVGEKRHLTSMLPYAIPAEKKVWYTKILLSNRSGRFTLQNDVFQQSLLNLLSHDMKASLGTAWLGRDPGFKVDSHLVPVILGFVLATGATLEGAKENAFKLGVIGSQIVNDNIASEVYSILQYDTVKEEKEKENLTNKDIVDFITPSVKSPFPQFSIMQEVVQVGE